MSGLSEITVCKINDIFRKHENIESAVLYGSRALGTFRNNSDIDITLTGKITFSELLQIEGELDDLLLPYKIDLSIFDTIQNQDLIEHVKRAGKIFYKKAVIRN